MRHETVFNLQLNSAKFVELHPCLNQGFLFSFVSVVFSFQDDFLRFGFVLIISFSYFFSFHAVSGHSPVDMCQWTSVQKST